MTLFFTADLHFGHKKIVELSKRPFSTVEEMDSELIRRWNSVVKKGDTVYVLGDFSFGDTKYYLSQLVGNIVRIKGNHDHDIENPRILSVKPEGLLDEFGNQRRIILCHYSMRRWEDSHYASWHLFGHNHGRLEPYGLSFDVGVDNWNYYPISLEQVKEEMSKLMPLEDFRGKVRTAGRPYGRA